jgi:hypothetical protein
VVSSSNGNAVDLTDVDATFIMYDVDEDGTKSELVNAAATVETPATDGYVNYAWQAGDTTEIGTHLAAFELVFTAEGNRKETYPSSGWILIEIQPDLENA